jgi:UDP-glucose 4-epimerase|tara:strand:+ start:1458 stop:2414 length:957 start_codon:yes stop_codon:yes gene_type:complete
MNNEEKTILVTGGSGFIGSVTCKLLVDSGYNVINIDRVKRQQEGVTQYPFDIDNHQLKGVIELTKPDAVIHLAADHSVPLSIQDPASTYANNVANSISLLNHSINAGVKHFIFSSSSSVYGDSETILNAESDIPNPKTPYGRSKLIFENVLKDYANAYEFNFASLRYFNAAGSYEGLGYTLNPKQHLVPILVDAGLNEEVFTINGDDYETPDGTCIRDYTHIFDVASAHVSALNYLMDGGDSNIFNIGGGSGSSIKQVIAEVEKQLGKEINVEVGPKRDGDAERTDANIVKAFEMLGWEPQNTLEEIVADEIAYQSKK